MLNCYQFEFKKASHRISEGAAEADRSVCLKPNVMQDAKPHASIAWLLGDEEKAIQDHILRVVEAHPHRGLAGREVVWSQQVGI